MDCDSRLYQLVPLTTLDTETQMQVRELRNENAVRRWMFTDHPIGANEHLAWIKEVKNDPRRLVFVVLDARRSPVGAVSAQSMERSQHRTDWAIYLTESAWGGLGTAIGYRFLDFLFSTCDMEKVNSEVVEGNDRGLRLQTKLLFQTEGFRRSQLVRAGVRCGVHLLGLTKAEWLAGRDCLREREKERFERFRIDLQWDPPGGGPAPHPIDQIEAARARNNLNWMSILRLALEKSPATAKPIVAEIKRLDREISSLTDKLTEENA